MEFVIIKQNTPEWEEMWNWLAKHPINEGLDEPSLATNDNESWQYMGSYRKDDKVISDFRHRNHPVTNNLYQVSFAHIVSNESIVPKE